MIARAVSCTLYTKGTIINHALLAWSFDGASREIHYTIR